MLKVKVNKIIHILSLQHTEETLVECDKGQLKLGVRTCCGQPVLVLSGLAVMLWDEQWLRCRREGAGQLGGRCALHPFHPIHEQDTWQHSYGYRREGYSSVHHPAADIGCKGKATG